ncbi:MAG: DUF6268 family outer membrane beta-barrel protein [Maribacter sp.]
MKQHFICCLFFTLTCFFGFSQTPDIFRLEYTFLPENKANIQLSRVKLVANLPITLKDSSNIIVGAEYNRIAYDVQRSFGFDNEGFNLLHVLDVNLAYVHKYNSEWRIIGVLTPRLASTLTNPLENGDFFVNLTAGGFRDRRNIEKPSRLVLGLSYNSSVALRIPLPIVYYEKQFHPKWTYVVGVPKTAMRVKLEERSTLQLEFILDGYYVNLQNNVLLSGTDLASSISSSAALVTFGYQYNFNKAMSVYAYAGHTLFQSSVLRDNDRKDIFTLNDEHSFYFRTGFRIGI